MPPLRDNKKNDQYRILERRQRIARLYLQGLTQHEIARQVGLTQAAVSLALTACRRYWQEESKRDFEEKLALELAKLNELEREAWDAWRSSRDPISPRGSPRPGDSRFLERVQRCIELRLRAMGALSADTNVNLNQLVIPWDKLAESIPASVPDAIEVAIAQAAVPSDDSTSHALTNGFHSENPYPNPDGE